MRATKLRQKVYNQNPRRSPQKICEIVRRIVLRKLAYRPLCQIQKATKKGTGHCSFRKPGTGKTYTIKEMA